MREEEKKRTSKITKVQQFFRKRWVFPAIYLVSAAVVLTAVLWYQAVSKDVKDQLSDGNQTGQEQRDDAVEVGKPIENVTMPVQNSDNVSVVKKFYEADADQKEKEAALVNYNNTYTLSKGIDLADKDGKVFDVTAALSGTVVQAKKDPVLGHVVEIEHEDGLSTVYQSLSQVSVKEGDEVKQNDVIGASGKNLYGAESGNHVHFEIRMEGLALNPLSFIDKPVSTIEKAAQEVTEQAKEPAQPKTEEKTKEPAAEDKAKEPAGEKSEEKSDEKGKSSDQEKSSDSSKDSSQSEETKQS
ncbi:peptidoglycan DD-metalloendopeptidase family protein [Bacillus safensis]|uniref:peptidoglycan DD-metalloendopeptidase family protein n=1 Tax=Bacillus safensis TaxID=561879 RepID=UPI00041EBB31|nr:peptidoglycan DD-metalloendopeptidase family protein [Bacillus safensis]MBR0605015.1 peptidoglycan DD-metalloendopeptidase family protein [Bacillus safensis]MCY7472687.1 peptidoglycan DD-metalloendopeptidase family protein [Bacillus safensis]